MIPSDVLIELGGYCLERHGTFTRRIGPPNRSGETLKESATLRSSAGRYLDRDGILRVSGADILRPWWADLDGDGRKECYVLSEPAATNVCLRSESLDNASWTKARVTISADADTAPDGTVSADRLVEDATASNTHTASASMTITADAAVCCSIYAKAGTRSIIALRCGDAANTNQFTAWFNLATGVVGTKNGAGTGTVISATMEAVGNGWYRCVLAGKVLSGVTAGNLRLYVCQADGSVTSNGDGASYLSVWGAQVVDNTAMPTSYVTPATAGASQARAAETLDVAANLPVQDYSILWVLGRPMHADATGTLGVFPGLGKLGTANPCIGAYFNSATRVIASTVRDASNNPSISSQSIPAGNVIKVLAQYRNLNTSPETRLDVGSGFSGWNINTATCTAFTAFGNQTVRAGYFDTQFAGPIRLMSVIRGVNVTLTEVLAYYGLS